MRVGRAADGEQQVGADDLVLVAVHAAPTATASACGATRMQSDSVRTRTPSDSRTSCTASDTSGSSRPISPRAPLDDGDLAAEAPEDLAELEPDVAAAHDDEVLGQHVELEHPGARQVLDAVEAGQLRDEGPRADVEEDPVALEPLAVHLDGLGRDEARVPADQLDVLHALEPVGDAAVRLAGDRLHARVDAGHVDAHRPVDDDAEVRRAARMCARGRWPPRPWSGCSRR